MPKKGKTLLKSNDFNLPCGSSNISAVIGSQNIYKVPVFESASAGFGAYAGIKVIEYIPVIITNPADVDKASFG